MAVTRAAALVAAFMMLGACTTALQRASVSYKQSRDEPSLRLINEHLRVGMPRSDVLTLLGPPDYSPTAGQDNSAAASSKDVLVIDYREDDRPTDRVTKIDLIKIAE